MTISYEDDNLDDILNNTDNTGFMPRVAPAIAAVGAIPGVGEVVITAARVILVGGIVVKAGTALYDKAVQAFSKKKPAEHTKNARKSTKSKHEKGQARKNVPEKKKTKKGWKNRK